MVSPDFAQQADGRIRNKIPIFLCILEGGHVDFTAFVIRRVRLSDHLVSMHICREAFNLSARVIPRLISTIRRRYFSMKILPFVFKFITCPAGGQAFLRPQKNINISLTYKIEFPIFNIHERVEEMIAMKERRKAHRLKEESDVTITVVSEGKHQKVIYDSSRDISVYGAKIHSREMLPLDTLLEIDFTTKTVHKNIITLGKVKWIKVIIEDASYEVGVEFVKNPGDAVKKLEDYISWKQKHTKVNPLDV